MSVVIAARNELENLHQLLPALLAQEYGPGFEIIIVDDRSDDGSYDWLLEQSKLHPQLKRVHVETTPEHVNPKKFALTLGIKAAQYEQILLTDADCMPSSGRWIAQMMAPYSRKNVDIVLGFSPYEKKPGLLNAIIQYETLYVAIQYLSRALGGTPYMGVGRNLSYKKALFFKQKGFHAHKHVTGGDDDLFINAVANKNNTAIVYNTDAQTVSIPETTWNSWYRQKTRHLSVGQYYRFRDKLVLGLLHLSHIGFYIGLFLMAGLLVFPFALISLYLVRMGSQLIVFYNVKKKIDPKFGLGWVPLLDFLYFLYYIFAGFSAFATKRTTWK